MTPNPSADDFVGDEQSLPQEVKQDINDQLEKIPGYNNSEGPGSGGESRQSSRFTVDTFDVGVSALNVASVSRQANPSQQSHRPPYTATISDNDGDDDLTAIKIEWEGDGGNKGFDFITDESKSGNPVETLTLTNTELGVLTSEEENFGEPPQFELPVKFKLKAQDTDIAADGGGVGPGDGSYVLLETEKVSETTEPPLPK